MEVVYNMKSSNTSERLKQLMKEKNLRQVDILEKCMPFCEQYNVKLGRNDLSQYVNGKVEPGQEKLTVLGKALDVNEAWLMGYDVAKERKEFSPESAKKDIELIEKFSMLNQTDKQIIMDLMDSLLKKAGN